MRVWQDVRHAARLIWKQPRYAIWAIVTLALGVGGTTAVFSVVNGVLLNPLPYRDSDALVRIVHNIGGIDQPYFSDVVYLTYAENTRAFEDVGVWSPETTATITGRGNPEEVRVLAASRGVLTTLGVAPELGRWFSQAEDAPGSQNVVVLTHGYWQRVFGGSPSALGQALTINGRPHEIVGVMPAGFRFTDAPEIVLPLGISTAAPLPVFRLVGLARLRPGVTLTEANADAARVLKVWFDKSGTRPEVRARWAPALRSLKQDVVGDIGTTLWVLMGAIAIVLVMACANVANLLLVRAEARRPEFAIRAALGARWTEVARHLLVESLTLAVFGGVLGVTLAFAGLRLLAALAPPNLPRLQEVALDGTVLAFALAVSLLSGLLFGLLPIIKYARPRFADAMGGGRSAGVTHERQRSQQVLVAAQVALAVVLLISAGLMIRSFHALRHLDPGFTEPQHLQTFTFSIRPNVAAEPERVTRMQQAVLERIGRIPGVASAAFTTRVPMGPDRSSAALSVEGRPPDNRTPPNRQVKIVSPGTFQTLGTRLVAGRDFTWTDLYNLHQVAIVSENLARELWGSPAAALGQRVNEFYAPKSPWREIVGVAADVHDDGADRPAPASIYWPAYPSGPFQGLSGYQARRVTVAIRTERAGTDGFVAELRDALRSVDAGLPLSDLRTLDEVYGQSLARASFTLVMLAIAGAISLLLGVSGLYGVITYAVSQRRREIGVRMALGADAREIRRLFVGRGLVVGGTGLAMGLVGATGVTRLMESLLFGVSPFDPLTFTATPIALAAAAALASYVPARHAAAVDPVESLRTD